MRPLVALLALVVTFGATAPIEAATGSTVSASVTGPASEFESVLQRGLRYEDAGAWIEALNLYEEALRNIGEDQNVRAHFNYVKGQYDVTRRFQDDSYVQLVTSGSDAELQAILADLLLKIQTHHVDTPNWRDLVNRGCDLLEIALQNEVFREQFKVKPTEEQVLEFGRELRVRLSMRPVRSRHDARNAIVFGAQLAHEKWSFPTTVALMEFTCASANYLDDYSSFLTPAQLREVYSQIDGNFVGLGIELKAEDNSLMLVRVIPGSPAANAGLKAGHRVVSVDGRSVVGMSTDEAANLLQGEEDSYATLSYLNEENQRYTVRVQRQRVEVPSIDNARIIDKDNGVAYLKLVSFQKTTNRDFDAALWKLHREGMRSLIIDLRGNPGGLLTASVEVADKFVASGTIVSTKGRNPREDFTYSAHRAGTWRVPLVVLIDGDSASASEILSGALRDHRRATIVGVRSYGKGSVQGIFPLAGSSVGIRLTTAKFYSPTGRGYSRVGVDPHIEVKNSPQIAADTVSELRPVKNDDAAIDTAVEVAKQYSQR